MSPVTGTAGSSPGANTKVRRALAYTFGERYATLAINLLCVAALARLLTPEEFGVLGVTMAIIMLANAVREYGASSYLIQKPDLTPQTVRTVFTVSVALSVALAVAVAAFGRLTPLIYGDRGISDGLAVLAMGLLFMPIPGTIMGLLRREMAFGALALCGLANALVGGITSVALAAHGAGFMSLIWGNIAGTVALTAVALACRPDCSIFRPCLRNWAEVLTFGGYASANTVINALYDAVPQLIMGRTLGFSAVGLYTRAVVGAQVFDKALLDAVQPIIMPLISTHARQGSDLKVSFLRGLEYITALQWPGLLFLVLMTKEVVLVMFGPDWLAITPLVRLLAISSMALFGARLVYPVLVVLGHVKDTMILSAISVSLSIAILTAASFFGILAVAVSTLVIAPLQAFIAFRFIRRRMPFTMEEVWASVRKSALIAIGTLAGPLGLRIGGALALDNALLELAVAGLAAGAGWSVAVLATRHPLADELHLAAHRCCRRAGRRPVGFGTPLM